ncbi:hypothetical protein QTI24_28405 [Variovorax sp. J22P240]|uniref:hypothetical protein n=1 Tax=Variovorax sp. J22P240 TaxID=3053514 RepID=UPI002577EC77|nr:hypothetical protein [Variovorax sp. J22P240]MDM0002555.1 hypothetical protein [Variovorax sp. J22P240]
MTTSAPLPNPTRHAGDAATPRPVLSPFEGHCLCRRTRECAELLQLAVLGVEQTRERHAPDADLVAIAEHLAQAEHHVERARQLASRWSE